MAKRRRDEFVTGYGAEGQCLYGKQAPKSPAANFYSFTAEEALEDLPRFGKQVLATTIYRLVPWPPAKVEAQAERERKAKGKR